VKPSERRLALTFVGVLVLGATWVSVLKLRQWSRKLDEKALQVERAEVEQEALLEEKDFWLERQEFLETRMPRYAQRLTAERELRTIVENTARREALDMKQPQILEQRTTPFSHESGLALEGTGSFPAVGRFLISLQQPSEFISIREMSLVAIPDSPGNVKLNLSLVRHYRSPDMETPEAR